MTFVLLAHGSPDPRSAAAVRTAADHVGQLTGRKVVAVFLDHNRPRLGDLAAASQPDGHGLTLLPLLLSDGYHASIDVRQQVNQFAPKAHLLPPLGHPPELLDQLLLANPDPTVLVASGSRNTASVHAFTAAVAAAARRTGRPARAAFATGVGPRIPDVATREHTVVPFLLAPGALHERVISQARHYDLATDTRHLLVREELLRVVAQRIGTLTENETCPTSPASI